MKTTSNPPLAFRPTDKNRGYLQKLGLLTKAGKPTRRKALAGSLSETLNQCVTMVFESYKNPRNQIATKEELKYAVAAVQIQKLTDLREDALEEIKKLRSSFTPEMEKLHEEAIASGVSNE